MPRKTFILLPFFSLLMLLFSCDPGSFTGEMQNRFTSADPAKADRGGMNNLAGEDGNSSNNANNGQPTDPGTGPAREISEADIVKVDGDTLYALSAYRGLMIVDISNPAALRVLGRAPVYGVPFEMYVEDGVAYVIFSSFWTYTWNESEGYGTWSANSKLVTLDVHNPANIQKIREFDLFGEISDSRKVGDIIYLVAYENGYCWGCSQTPRTTVTSIRAGSASEIEQIDQLSFEDENSEYSWGPRSIHVNTQRIYIGGRTWGEEQTSEIQVVDISDPSGVMDEGAAIPVAGSIDNRWQMDEYDGVFRVISQPAWSSTPPTIQTFSIQDSQHFTPLGSLQMHLPPGREQLMSVRFDGTHAYAVTFERTDPLFVIDLSNPAIPRQRGELEIPGWLEHMEPRGDRLIALGYDFDADEALTLSLFDVSNPDAPAMLARVNFGGNWSWMVEDQDRIHKALRILDERGLILMPYAGWGDAGYESGIQLFSFTRDTLTKRAAAPHTGFARRAFIHRDRLFAVSDERIESFDIGDLDHPVLVDTLKLARAVYNLVPFGDGYVAEIVQDWWAHTARLDILTLADPDSMTPVGSLDLASLIFPYHHPYYYWWNIFDFSRTRIFANGNYLYLIWGENYWYWDYYYDESGNPVEVPEEERVPTRLAVFDVSDPSAPELVSLTNIPYPFPWQRGHWSWWYTAESGDNVVQVGNAIVVKRDTYDYWWYGYDDASQEQPEIYVIDASVPEAPVVSYTMPRQEGVRYGALIPRGSTVVTSYYEPVPGAPEGTVAFYMHRLNLSDPANPQWLPPVNVPGSVVDFNPSTNRIITVDYQIISFPGNDWDECYENAPGWYVWFEDGECRSLQRRLAISAFDGQDAWLQRTHIFDGWIRNVRATGSRVFVDEQPISYWYWYDTAENGQEPDTRAVLHVIPLNSSSSDIASSVRMSSPYAYLVEAFGNHALVVSDTPPTLSVYNAANPQRPVSRGDVLLTGYSYDMQFVDGYVVSANSMWGVQVIEP